MIIGPFKLGQFLQYESWWPYVSMCVMALCLYVCDGLMSMPVDLSMPLCQYLCLRHEISSSPFNFYTVYPIFRGICVLVLAIQCYFDGLLSFHWSMSLSINGPIILPISWSYGPYGSIGLDYTVLYQ